jgi:hypothetical protein
MIARYGRIPIPSTTDGSGAHSLGLFLNDFVINFGVLRKHDEEMMDAEQGNVNDLLYTRDSRDSTDDGVDLPSMGQRSEVPLGESDDWNMTTCDDDQQSSLPLPRRHPKNYGG